MCSLDQPSYVRFVTDYELHKKVYYLFQTNDKGRLAPLTCHEYGKNTRELHMRTIWIDRLIHADLYVISNA